MAADLGSPPALLITPQSDGSWRVEVTASRAILGDPVAPAVEPLLDSRGMARVLGVGDTLVEAMAKDGRIPSIRVGDKALRFQPTAVIAALRGEG